MALVEWQKQRPFVKIDLKTNLDNILTEPPCMVCGYPTKKVFLEHTCGTDIIILAEKIAGYRCPRGCDFECLSHEALAEMFDRADVIMSGRGDSITAMRFREGAQRERQIIEEDRLAMPR